MNLEYQLEQADEAVSQVRSRLLTAQQNQRKVQLAIIKRDFNIEKGSIVKNRKGERFKVESIGPYYGYKGWVPSLDGYKEKKDGSWSARETYIGQWTHA